MIINSILVDTSFVFALIDKSDRNNRSAAAAFMGEKGELLFPALALTELAHLLNRKGGSAAVIREMRLLRQTRIVVVDLHEEDYGRALDILDKYIDSRIDFVDACLMALAERLKITRVLTFDRRDFGLYRPVHVEHFDLLP